MVDTQRVRFRLKEPWPDFMAFYGTPATGAGWIVPRSTWRRSVTRASRRRPIGAGPYKFVSFNPGVELVLEAHEEYWRKTPSVKRLVLKSVPDESTRLAMLKSGEVDIAYSIRGALAEELRRTPGLALKATYAGDVLGDVRGSVGPEVAVGRPAGAPGREPLHNRKAINRRRDLGLAKMTRQHHSPELRLLLAGAAAARLRPRAGQEAPGRGRLTRRLRRRDYTCDTSYAISPRPSSTTSAPSGFASRLRPLERAGFFKEYAEKKLKNVIQGSSGAFGNAATRIEAFVAAGGAYVYGSYPDIEGLVASRGRARSQEAGADPASHPAAPARQGGLRADLGARAPERPGPARGGVRPRADLQSRLLGPVRGAAAEEAVSTQARIARADGYRELAPASIMS